jgi:hypothetical protein
MLGGGNLPFWIGFSLVFVCLSRRFFLVVPRRLRPFAPTATSKQKQVVARERFIENHLSPSRRRALCPFFVQTGSECKRCPCPSPLRGLGDVSRLHRLQRFAKKCSGIAYASQGGRGVGTQTRCPVYGDYGCENLLQAVCSFSEPFISGVNQRLPNPMQKRL